MPRYAFFIEPKQQMKKVILVPLKLISLDQDGCHLMLKARINNRVARLILDTGASKTVFDQHKIRHFLKDEHLRKNEHLSTGLGTNKMVTHVVTLKKFSLGKLTIRDFQMVLLDLKHIGQSYELLGLPAVDGVLGGDLLREFGGVIDYGRMELKLTVSSIRKKMTPFNPSSGR